MLAFILAKVESGRDGEVLGQIKKLREAKKAYHPESENATIAHIERIVITRLGGLFGSIDGARDRLISDP